MPSFAVIWAILTKLTLYSLRLVIPSPNSCRLSCERARVGCRTERAGITCTWNQDTEVRNDRDGAGERGPKVAAADSIF